MKENEYRKFIDDLPEAPGILCRDLYFNSAVLIPFFAVNDELHLLFQKRAADIRQGSEICFPGGRYDRDLDSNFQETAVRETAEELGIKRKDIDISRSFGTLVTPRGVIVEAFIGRLAVDSMDDLKPDPREVEEIFTLPVSWFIDNKPEIYFTRVEVQSTVIGPDGKKQILLPVEELGLPAKYGKNRKGMNYRVVVYKAPNHIIWGITAGILFELIQMITKGEKTKEGNGPLL